MDRKEVIKELEKYLGIEVSDDFLDMCIVAYKSGHHGPAALGGMAVMGYYTPFKFPFKFYPLATDTNPSVSIVEGFIHAGFPSPVDDAYLEPPIDLNKKPFCINLSRRHNRPTI